MAYTLRVNARNDLRLPAELLRQLNLGREKMVKFELAGLDRLHKDEKKKGWIRLRASKDIDRLLS